jgi:hypothetical protein
MKTPLALSAALPVMLLASAALAGDAAGLAPEDVPPGAVPGHCYQHVALPPTTETYQERVVDVPEHTATRTIPAVYGEQTKEVMVRPGRVEHIHIPATYRWVSETEIVRPETSHDEVIPALYDNVTERVMVREAHTEWRRGYGPVSDPDMPRYASDRDIVCLVEVPAEYRLETRQIERRPERVIHITTPAVVRTRTRQVVDEPARDEERDVPPIYTVVKEQVVLQPERTETYTVPATYRMATRTRVVAPGRLEWREFACRKVVYPPVHPRPETDGERGALDPSKLPAAAVQPMRLAKAGTAPQGQ